MRGRVFERMTAWRHANDQKREGTPRNVKVIYWRLQESGSDTMLSILFFFLKKKKNSS
jgi:hypothetical protein